MGQLSLLIVGNPEAAHVGAHFLEAAQSLELDAQIHDSRQAFAGPRWLRTFNWRIMGRRPTRLGWFSAELVSICRRDKPTTLLATGLSPISAEALREVSKLGVRLVNYLTDDPWNPAHRASWFLGSVRCYDQVYSTRLANLDDLRLHGCASVSYLPFAYSPSMHLATDMHESGEENGSADLIFAGGADPDRVPYLEACIKAGFRVSIHGGYWERYRATREFTEGISDPARLRLAYSQAKASLCLVRRANRDGHVMRSYELPALGVCMLTEDTEEHRRLFGADGENVLYFRTPQDAVTRLRWLIDHDRERSRLAASAHRVIVQGKNTYRDRLEAILNS